MPKDRHFGMEVQEVAAESVVSAIAMLVGLDSSCDKFYMLWCEVNVEAKQSGATSKHSFTFDIARFAGAAQ
jgi:hypothetical protein